MHKIIEFKDTPYAAPLVTADFGGLYPIIPHKA